MTRRDPERPTSALIFVAVCLAPAVACTADPHALEWGVRFESSLDRDRAALVQVEIREDGCAGAPLYAATLDPSASSSAPPPAVLPRGRYGFAARARDATCVWFAEDCLEETLPQQAASPVIVTLVAGAEMAECPIAECMDGFCEGELVDAGMDGGPPDDGGPPPDDGGPPPDDGGPPPDDGGRDSCVATGMESCNDRDDDCDGRTDEGGDTLCRDDLASCTSGSCTCSGGLLYDPAGGDCVDADADPSHCGGIGGACAASEVCASGSCECRPGLSAIATGECVDFDTDPSHCGGEGNDCSTMGSMQTCRGSCEDACSSAAGQTNCSNACVILSRDPFHCGACGNACAADEVCVSSSCRSYQPARLCSSCPCSDCESSDACCTYGGNRICVSGTGSCPAP